MSACISSHGEFSEHEMDETGFACLHCGFDDIEAMCARIAQLEAAVEERSGWCPPARVIGEQAELDALPVGSIVSDNFAAGCTRVHPDPLFGWVRATSAVPGGQHCHAPYLPATVLWEPQTAEEACSDGR
ncbi:hypothetical protein [Nocardia brasiliensis]|uniref:hypothetical protein n=1 Tax=Nocardia brasiliensis TaxID=37326 RepID=UPI00245572DC|nr:hypothetical protein [Nocardia brasiliensis]